VSNDIHEHGHYIAAVAEAMHTAGLALPDPGKVFWDATDYDPRGGAIRLDVDALVTDHDEVWVSWREDQGWFVATVDDADGPSPRRHVFDLDCPTVSSPSSVVRVVRGYFGVPPDGRSDDDYPDVDFPDHHWEDDDPAFEAALAVYAEVPDVR
jgi:hypothetical protein